jgi:hypothetical protein
MVPVPVPHLLVIGRRAPGTDDGNRESGDSTRREESAAGARRRHEKTPGVSVRPD